jgi:hypothetical protein
MVRKQYCVLLFEYILVVEFNICEMFLNIGIPATIYFRFRRLFNITYIFDMTKAFFSIDGSSWSSKTFNNTYARS